MNPSLGTGILLAVEGALFVLPILPAFEELRLKRDAAPLNVVQKYSGDVRHFAFGFRDYIRELMEPLDKCVETGSTLAGRRKNGEEYVLLGRGAEESFVDVTGVNDSNCNVVICSGTDLRLPDSINFRKEIYSAGSLLGGEENTYRAILGERDVHLRRKSQVMRWAHAARQFRADHECNVYGRVSSGQEIFLQSRCTFQRLNAPRIAMGCGCEAEEHAEVPATSAHGADGAGSGRKLIDGDVEIRPGEVVAQDLIARGNLRIGARARMLGSVKSNQDLIIEDGVFVGGSVISTRMLQIGRKCQIHGPVLAEHRIAIGSGTFCGGPDSATTVSSPVIDVEEGALFFGTVWAREEGRVLPKE